MIIFSMFLATLNLINRYYYCVFIAAIIFFLKPNRKVRLNYSTLSLLCLSLSILTFDPLSQDRILDMIKPFVYPLCYLMGCGLYQRSEYEKIDLLQEERNISKIIYALSGGAMLHFVLNMIVNKDAVNRNVVDYWTGTAMSATGQAALACFMLAVAIAFLFTKSGKIKKVIAIAVIVTVVSYNLVLAGRTLFVLIVILAAAAFFFARFAEKKKIFRTAIIALVIVAALGWLYNVNAFGIKETVEASNFSSRFDGSTYSQEIDEDARTEYKLAYLEHFLDYPWGGENIKELIGHHAHDLYLDTYDEASVFAFLAVVAYILMSLIRMVKCIKNDRLTVATRTLVLCIYLSCNIIFWLEPILRGMPWLFSAYCFMDGAVTALIAQMEDMEYSNTYLSISKRI